MDLIKVVEQAFANEKRASYPKFKAGDTITVTYRIKEGDKERLQKFRGTVSMDMNLGKLQEIVKDREAWHAVIYRISKSWTQLNNNK